MSSYEYFLDPLFDENVFDRKKKLRITIYGPYGSFKSRIKNIAKVIRENHHFTDCYIVAERRYTPDGNESNKNVKLTKKSYHYLKNSHAVVFIFFCDEEGKIAHQESPAIEFKHMEENYPEKKVCSLILKDKKCRMATILEGEIHISRVKVIPFNGKKENIDADIVQYINSTCMSFLKEKYFQLT